MSDHFNVVVIGGGIHGVGVAQAAVCAGYSVLVLEKHGLATGTSSRSSKLIHGGLRYLEGFDLALVRESLAERTLLLKLAPELVRLAPFHIPVYRDTSRRPLTIRVGLSLYALLGGLRASCRFRKLPRHEWSDLDGLQTKDLQAVYQYQDAQTNDADLTLAVMQSAINLGAVLACPAEFMQAETGDSGCDVEYRQHTIEKTCTADCIVNATGPWVPSIAQRISPATPLPAVELVQGTHLVVGGGLEKGCYYLEVPTDRRAVFLLPWYEDALLGTTESIYRGEPEHVEPLDTEVDYLLAVLAHYFPNRSQTVLGRFAGLRVLPETGTISFKRSRETQLPVDDSTRPRVISVLGGKLTGYRITAERVMKILQRTLPQRKPLASTSELELKPV